MSTPQRAVILARISFAKNGDEHGVKGQAKDGRDLARRIGWKVGPERTHLLVENDTSAFKRRKIRLPDGRVELRTVRPKFRQALKMLADGRADGLIAIDLDRVARDPRDLEDLIDVVEARTPRIPVESVTGSLRLANDADVTMARVMVVVANKSSRDTARRVANSHSARAASGEYRGGTRPFGYERDGITLVPGEAAEVRKAARAILDGASLRSLVADLRSREVPTVTGAEWCTRSLRDILLRARNAGIAVYRGEEVGRAEWPPILEEDEWRAVCAVLTDPARRTSPGNAPRHLGSLIYICGICGGTVHVNGTHRKVLSYVCSGHLRRSVASVDELVTSVLTGRLARPDASTLLAAREDGPDLRALRAEASVLRSRLNDQARLHARGVISTAQLEAGSAVLTSRLREAETAMETGAESNPVAGIAGRPDAVDVWDGLPLERQRAIVRALLQVTILPAKPGRQAGGGYFSPDSLDIAWRR